MKYKLLAPILLIIQFNVQAQVILNASDFPSEQESIFTRNVGSASGLPPGASGQNITWDFSMIENPNSFNNKTFPCDGNSECVKFPSSTYYDQETSTETKYFFRKDNAGIQRMGYNWTAYGEKDTFSDPMKMLVFPLTYNSAFDDTYSHKKTFANPSSFEKGDGSISGVVDGYGQIKTPIGTYANVLRLKSTTDETFTYNLSNPGPYFDQGHTVIYGWYQAGIGQPIFEIYQTTSSGGGLQPYENDLYYYTSTPPKNITSSQNIMKPNAGLNIFPNPSHGSFKIRAENFNIATILIKSITGNTVYASQISTTTREKEIITITWAKGIYFVEIENEKGLSIVRKIVVE